MLPTIWEILENKTVEVYVAYTKYNLINTKTKNTEIKELNP